MKGFCAWLIVATAAIPQIVAAQPTPVTGEFQVNTYTTSYQDDPKAAVDADGDFVVVWASGDQDGAAGGIFGQRLASDGSAAGSEFQVNTYTTGVQRGWRQVGKAADGSFVVVWRSYDYGYSSGVSGQRFDSTGTAQGLEFQVNTYTTSYQESAAVAVEKAGGFIVVWRSTGQDGDSDGVFGQRFDSSGTPRGSEFQVNTYTTNGQTGPDVAVDEDGDFVVVWQSQNQDGSSTGVFGQRFDSTGTAVGGEFQINTYTTSIQSRPTVAAELDGDFVVIWQSQFQDGASYGVFGQRFDSSGTPRGTEFQVNIFTTSTQEQPSVALDAAGDFVVVWASFSQDGSHDGVFGQLFDSSGTVSGSVFQVNVTTLGAQDNPSVASDAAGNFVVTWNAASDGYFGGVDARLYETPCSGSHSVPAGSWRMVSLPCDPGGSNTVTDAFGDDVPGTYDTDWVVYRRDEAGAANVKLVLTDTLSLREGYWVKTLDGATVDVAGTSQKVVDIPLTADSVDGVQNLVGHPFDFRVCWADVRVVDGASVLTLDEADPAGECQKASPGPTCVVSRIMNKWSDAYTPYDGATSGAEGELDPFDGIWVKAFKTGAKLRIRALPSTTCTTGGASLARNELGSREPEPESWFVRLVVRSEAVPGSGSETLEDRGNLLGFLPDSLDGYDSHDLGELPPFGKPYLTVVFPRRNWQQAGDYATDFRRSRPAAAAVWPFEVRTDVPRQITLTWEGTGATPAVLARSLLSDEDNGERIVPEVGGSYTVTLTSGVHRFSWGLDHLLFADGFESGDLSSWRPTFQSE